MKLKEFLEQLVEANSQVRLWYKVDEGHKMIAENDHAVMEHEILRYNTVLSEYLNNEVEHIFSVLMYKSQSPEAINISIKL